MSRHFCVYGHLANLDAPTLSRCAAALAHYECTALGSVLDFIHEGHYIDVDADIDALLRVLPPTTHGIIDIIDHLEWQMTRCTLRDGKLHRERIALDNALDTAYVTER